MDCGLCERWAGRVCEVCRAREAGIGASGVLGCLERTAWVGRMPEDGSGLMCERDEDVDPLEGTDEDLAVEVDPTGRFARYNVVLGKGSSKIVYKAFDRVQGIEVAWNQIRLSDSLKHPLRSRLFSEIAVLGKLKHRNIMTFYTSWLDDQHRTVNFITEYFHSGTLRRHRLSHKCITMKVLKRWAWQILQGLVYLHGHDPPIIHRDLKCDNIFIHGVTGEVKIGDLGMAKLLTSGLSKAQSVLGTPEYMAPELYDERYNEKVDIYAYGMCLMELVSMEFPYMECDNRCQIFRKVTLGVYPAALSRIEETEVRDFIELCISHDHMRRPSARELIKHPFFDSIRNEQELGCSPSHDSFSEGPDVSETKGACDDHEGLRTFHLRATEVQGKTVKFRLRMKNSGGSVKCLAFHFDAIFDTVDAVAREMEEDFDLLPDEAAMFSSLLEEEMVKARPFIEIGPRASGPLPPVPAGGTSSEMTTSCEGMSTELQEVASASEQCLSDEVTALNASDQLRSRVDSVGDKKAPKGPVEHNLSSLGLGDHMFVVKDCLQSSPWAFQDANVKMGVPMRTSTSGSRARSVKIHSLQRKRCASEPCLSLEEFCDFSPRLLSRVAPEGQPLMESLSVWPGDATIGAATQTILSHELENLKHFDCEDVMHSSTRAGGRAILQNDKTTVVQPPFKLQMSTKNVLAEMQCTSRPLRRSCGEETSPISNQPIPVNVSMLTDRSLSSRVGCNKAGSLRKSLQREQVGFRGSHDRRQSWSSTMKHEQQQGERKKAIGQWSGQEVKLLDLGLSRGVAKLAGNWDVQNTAMQDARRSGDPHHKFELNRQRLSQLGGSTEEFGCLKAYRGCCAAGSGNGEAAVGGHGINSHFEKYASMLHGKSSDDRLNSRPSALAGRSVQEIGWHMKSTETGAMQVRERIDGSSQDDVNHIERCASVPPQSAGGPAFIGPRAPPSQYSSTDRHSSPCGSSASGWRLWRKLAMRFLKRRKGENQMYVEPQIVASTTLFRCSSGSCVHLQHRDSSPIVPGLQAM